MLISQISVFLENKPGKLSEIVQMLAKNNIDIQALSLSETKDYGILHIIVDKTDETLELLNETNWVCKKTEVLSATVPDETGSLTKILSVLGENGINLAYTYAFFSRESGRASIILRVDDNETAAQVLKKAGVEI